MDNNTTKKKALRFVTALASRLAPTCLEDSQVLTQALAAAVGALPETKKKLAKELLSPIWLKTLENELDRARASTRSASLPSESAVVEDRAGKTPSSKKGRKQKSPAPSETDQLLSAAWAATHSQSSSKGVATMHGAIEVYISHKASSETAPNAASTETEGRFAAASTALRGDFGRPDRLKEHVLACALFGTQVTQTKLTGLGSCLALEKQLSSNPASLAASATKQRKARASLAAWSGQVKSLLLETERRRLLAWGSTSALSRKAATGLPAAEPLASLVAAWCVAEAATTTTTTTTAPPLSVFALGMGASSSCSSSSSLAPAVVARGCGCDFAAHLVAAVSRLAGPQELEFVFPEGSLARSRLASLVKLALATAAGQQPGKTLQHAGSFAGASSSPSSSFSVPPSSAFLLPAAAGAPGLAAVPAVRVLAAGQWCLNLAAAADATSVCAVLQSLSVPPALVHWLSQSEPAISAAAKAAEASGSGFALECATAPELGAQRWEELVAQASAAFERRGGEPSARADHASDGEDSELEDGGEGTAATAPAAAAECQAGEDGAPLFFFDSGPAAASATATTTTGTPAKSLKPAKPTAVEASPAALEAAMTSDLEQVFKSQSPPTTRKRATRSSAVKSAAGAKSATKRHRSTPS